MNQWNYVLCMILIRAYHRHLSNIDCLMALTACLVCFIVMLMATGKKEALEDWR
jgi:hypothetical protein